MNKKELIRYSRQMMLSDIGHEGQERLRSSRVMVVGLGGLGSSASIYLASSGIGHLVLVDRDTVELSNLQRQIIHSEATIGTEKVISAKMRLASLNPHVNLTAITASFPSPALLEELHQADVVVDASDNFATRFRINEACFREKIPLVSAAAIRHEAQISVFDLRKASSPCYRCIYEEEVGGGESCATNGVIPPLLGVVGSIQAMEVIKIIIGYGKTLHSKLLLLDLHALEWHTARVNPDPRCPVCGGQSAS